MTVQEVVFTTHTPVIQGNESHPIERLMYMELTGFKQKTAESYRRRAF